MITTQGEPMKKNCWEFMECGREPDGVNVDELGICPTPIAAKANGIHEGKNGGRCCWAIAGTLSGKEVQCTFAKRLSSCFNCKFYERVTQEEIYFLTTAQIMKTMD